MTKWEIEKLITKIALDVAGVELNETETLKESGLDSLSLVAVIAETENRLKFSYTDSELDPENLQTLSDLVRITENHIWDFGRI